MVQSKDTEAILKENYQPTTYKGDAPEPLPKVNEELPWEQFSKKIGQFHEKVDEKLKQATGKKEELGENNEPQSGGAVSSIVGAATDLLSKVSNKVGHGLQEFTKDAMGRIEEVQKTRLQQRFSIEKEESLMYEYSCSIVMKESTGVLGFLYVTTQHLGFWSDCGDHQIKLWLPLESIVSIQPGTALTTKDGKGIFIQRVESGDVTADSILVYTKQNEVHKFYKFGASHDPINSYWSHVWNVLDHAWRDSGAEIKQEKQKDDKDTSKTSSKDSSKKDSSKDSSMDFSDSKSSKDSSKKDSSKDSSMDFSKDTSKDSSGSTKDFSSDFMSGVDYSTYGSSKMGAGSHSTITAAGYGSSGLFSDSSATTSSTQSGAHGSASGAGTGIWSEISSSDDTSKMSSESSSTSTSLDSKSSTGSKDAGWSGLSDSVLSTGGNKASDFSGDPISTTGTTSGLGSDTTTYGTTSGLGSDTTTYGTIGGLNSIPSSTSSGGISSGLGPDTTTYGTTSGLGSDTTSYGTTSGLGSDITSGTTTGVGSGAYGTTSGFGSETTPLKKTTMSTEKLDSEKPPTGSVF